MAAYRTVTAKASVTSNYVPANAALSESTINAVGSGQKIVVVDPYIDIQQEDYGAVITVTDSRGSTQATIYNGKNGDDNYEVLRNKPKINSIELIGNKTSVQLGLADAYEIAVRSQIDNLF